MDITVPDSSDSKAFQPTMNLRFLKRTYKEKSFFSTDITRTYLQQQWIDTSSGETVWRTIPVVNETVKK